ncbi:MAG: hypothetical protein PHF37_02225 [Phycisphaerae bacterium]|nr:hypothetical protein [Phycisphaerae bacterium]
MAAAGGELFVAVGPKAKVYSVKPAKEISEMFFEDKQSSQVTSIEPAAGKLYLGLANPAKLVLCEKALAKKGTYQSSLIDASRPAQWGKIQLNADITAGTKLLVSTRTGNVGDVNDGSFSHWTQPVEVKGAVDINSPTGRFCQYKLIFEANEPLATAIVRAAAVSFTVPNLAPKIESVTIEKTDEKGKKPGVMNITCKASDDNEDTLIYDIDFRRLDRTGWIKLTENIEEDNYQWDTRTVEDGRYEVRVRASDIRDNSPATVKTAVRISDPFVIDNTGPQLLAHSEQAEKAEVVISMIVSDQFSAIKKVDYTIDSNENWKGAIADDLVFDTTTENVTIRIEGLKKGDHVIAVRMTDAAENVTYTTLDAKI